MPCAFENIEGGIEVVGCNTCGGCPGKKAVTRAAEMVNPGVGAIVSASCITRGNPIGFPCPHARALKGPSLKNWVNQSKSSIMPTKNKTYRAAIRFEKIGFGLKESIPSV